MDQHLNLKGFFMKILRSESGMGLVGVLVIMGVVATLAYNYSQWSVSQIRTQKMSDEENSYTSVQRSVEQVGENSSSLTTTELQYDE
jgi:hypothetical protein